MAERRYDLLRDEWVIVSPHRLSRPWQGDQSSPPPPLQPEWAEECYLCPRNQRTSGERNPDFRGVFVFDNDHPALDQQAMVTKSDPMLLQQGVTGTCRVLCYSERHDLTLSTLNDAGMLGVVDAWAEQYADLSQNYDWVQVFENRGAMMGASSIHPHGQIWASSHVPSIPAQEDSAQATYQATHRDSLLLAYTRTEQRAGQRVVAENGSWLVVVPWWAAWPFETLLMPLAPLDRLDNLSATQRQDLGEILAQLLTAYDQLFRTPMPYSMGWHGRGRTQGNHWQLHAHFYPPLLRSATVRKFMVGYEMLAEAQRDLTAEEAAARLREHVK